MASQVSPGVVVNEFDFSDYAERISTAICGVVGWAVKGPAETLTLVTNERQLIETFGPPPVPTSTTVAGTFGQPAKTVYYAKGLVPSAIQYLRQGNQLYVVRVVKVGTGTTTTTVITSAPATPTITLTATSAGTWQSATYANVTVKIEAGGQSGTNANYFKLTVYEKGVAREVFDNLLAPPNQLPTPPTNPGDPANEISLRMNGVSAYFTVTTFNTGRPLDGTYASGTGSGATTGNDGVPTTAADYYASATSGLNLFSNADTVDVNILMAPGVATEINDTTRTVETQLTTLAAARGDCIALVDPPFSVQTPTTAKDFANATGSFSGNSLNSSYSAYYWPWVEVYDNYNQKSVWVPPSGICAGVYAYNDRTTDTWWAPAGFTRGRPSSALSVWYNTTLGERESLYGPGQVVNPIVNFPGDGITVWGQKTTQRLSTALNRVNVRRMLNYAKKIISTSIRVLVFEPNDEFTWRRFVNLVNPVLQTIKDARGLYEFKVNCDATTNTPTLIDQNQMRGIILMKPTKAAEVITVDFTLLSTGAQFNEFVQG